ncbi:MAG: hypothetical protein WCC06_05615 [Candidatus Aminicenantales bacterium]
MVKKNIKMAVLIIIFCGFLSALAVEDSRLPVLKTEARSIAVFKNGLGFFMREGEVDLKEGWAITDRIPRAALGTLWMGVMEKGARLEEVISLKEERSLELSVISIPELFRANIGRRIAISFENKVIEGKIKAVPESRFPAVDASALSEPRRLPIPQAENATLLILETPQGDIAVNKNFVNKIEFKDTPVTKLPGKEVVRRMKFKVAAAGKNAKIGLFYLQKGICWMPSYLVDLVDEQKARLTMQALLVNDSEDFQEADLYFVVGYPNFIYADILSPMTLDQSLVQFLSSLTGGRGTFSGLGAIAAQRLSPLREEAKMAAADFDYASIPALEGEAKEDLFFYHKKGVSLKEGERAYYHIFSDLVEYKHIYEWTVPDTANVDARGYSQRERQAPRENVWHSLKLTNSTPFPWTTAPAFSVADEKPLAQDTIDYTPKGTSVNLKLTVASDIKTTRQEYEVERQRDVRLYQHAYDLVTVKGELAVKNSKENDVAMDIKKFLTGEVIKVSHGGKVQKLAEGLELRAVNLNSRISWEVTVKAGEEKTLTYTYRVYISH